MRYSGLLSDAVDEGLSKLGQLPKKAIYEALETDFSMQKKDIPTRFTEFSSILLGNIGPSARPLLEYIVDRFSSRLHTQSLSSIDLDESIQQVDMILNGSLNLPSGIDHSSRIGSAKTVHSSGLARVPQPESTRTIESGTTRLGHEDARKRISGRTGKRPDAEVSSEA